MMMLMSSCDMVICDYLAFGVCRVQPVTASAEGVSCIGRLPLLFQVAV